MACYHPLDAKLSPSGKPIFKNNVNYGRFTKLIKLPCGRCIGCKLDRSKTWAIRLMHEAQLHECKAFITLTIDDARAENHAHERTKTLIKKDLQLFTKRLREDERYKNPSSKIKYYAVGEYGEKLGRPHYHIALYGTEFGDDRNQWRTDESGPIYRSSRLERLWPYGNSEIGTLTFKSAAYIARYITKKLTPGRTDESKEAYHAKYTAEGKIPEFSMISNGLGKDWLTKYKTDVYPHDYVLMEGKQLKPPRYYDQLLELWDAEQLELVKEERERKRLEQPESESFPERLRVKEQVAIARLSLNKRTLE
ncbi:replication initiator protein [Blackfly microvirus SF02]|uniref:Replication initiator protein n=1 Tax=Blackfly microvirus SF02 TaxID=2576452 RepID=A0A4P8PK94_9VIRU|nr:replication initiator protein [Blackfly microvirus SF02]